MRISAEGLALVKRFEGFRSAPYRCPAGVWTIGYGTTHGITKDTVPITEEAAGRMLEYDLNEIGGVVGKYLPELPQNRSDAVLSFCYNVGVEAFAESGLCAAIRRNPDDVDSVRKEFMRWVHAKGEVLPGLVARRKAEADLYEGKGA